MLTYAADQRALLSIGSRNRGRHVCKGVRARRHGSHAAQLGRSHPPPPTLESGSCPKAVKRPLGQPYPLASSVIFGLYVRQHKSAYVPDCRLRRYVQIAEFLVLTTTWAGLLKSARGLVSALTLAMWAGLLKSARGLVSALTLAMWAGLLKSARGLVSALTVAMWAGLLKSA
jgi:hypothetical protein